MSGCGGKFRVSSVTDEAFICGVSMLGCGIWYCDDCLVKYVRTASAYLKVKKLNKRGNNRVSTKLYKP